jgi:hypothetical protein
MKIVSLPCVFPKSLLNNNVHHNGVGLDIFGPDAPAPITGMDPRFTFHGYWEQDEYAAGGRFWHPAKRRKSLTKTTG